MLRILMILWFSSGALAGLFDNIGKILDLTGLAGSPQVNTSSGLLQGSWKKTFTGKEYAAYEGVPYAEPPVKHLRFEPPQEVIPWNGTKIAKKQEPPCPQFLLKVIGSEDCLYLNFYVPKNDKNQNDNTTIGMPILFLIPGGAYSFGSGNVATFLIGPDLVINEDVILVTMNYRLGSLGFLHLGHVVTGNMGLKDQQMALTWVHKNARNFGGDPNRITIMGHGAGASSVEYQSLNPRSQKLIKGAIALSGSVFCPWAWTKPAELGLRSWAMGTVLSLECSLSLDPKQMLDCMKRMDYKHIVLAELVSNLNLAQSIEGAFFTPTVEPKGTPNAFLDDCPVNVLKDKERAPSNISYLTGYRTRVAEFVKNHTLGDALPAIKKLIKLSGKVVPKTLELSALSSLFQYVEPFVEHIMELFVNTVSSFLDRFENINPVIHSSKMHAEAGADVYLYNHDFGGEHNIVNLFYNFIDPRQLHIPDITLNLMQHRSFFYPVLTQHQDTPEAKALQRLIHMGANFVKTGKPSPGNSSENGVQWPVGPKKLLAIGEKLDIGDAPADYIWNFPCFVL